MFPKVHLTSHSKMSGSRWVTTPWWLSGSLRTFQYISSVYSCHLFLVSSASIRSLSFLPFIVPIFAWNVPLASPIFFKRSLVFPILLFSSIYLYCSLKKASLSLLGILRNSAFIWLHLSFSPLPFASLLSSAICKAASDYDFAFLHFFFFGMVLVTTSCTMLWPSIHRSLGTLSDLIPWIYFSFLSYNHKRFDLGHTWMVQCFPYFLQFKPEFCNKELLIWATISSQSCSCWLDRASMVAQTVKNLPAMQETQVWSLGGEEPLEKGMATHSSIFAWERP